MKNIISWSGGKDSTATIILAHERGISIDLIIISLLWFDKSREIYAENPEHINWVLNYAKPLFESWGYKVEVVSDDRDYLYWFNHILTKSKDESKNGKRKGWLIGGMCDLQKCKLQPIRKYLKQIETPFIIVEGIAADEKKRLYGMHQKRGHVSFLETYNVVENDTYAICKPYGLLSPIYSKRRRQGCWVCPNQSYEELADLKTFHPELYLELVNLSKLDMAAKGFKYGETFDEVDARVDAILENRRRQLTFEF